jgi:hypothetical protein
MLAAPFTWDSTRIARAARRRADRATFAYAIEPVATQVSRSFEPLCASLREFWIRGESHRGSSRCPEQRRKT